MGTVSQELQGRQILDPSEAEREKRSPLQDGLANDSFSCPAPSLVVVAALAFVIPSSHNQRILCERPDRDTEEGWGRVWRNACAANAVDPRPGGKDVSGPDAECVTPTEMNWQRLRAIHHFLPPSTGGLVRLFLPLEAIVRSSEACVLKTNLNTFSWTMEPPFGDMPLLAERRPSP